MGYNEHAIFLAHYYCCIGFILPGRPIDRENGPMEKVEKVEKALTRRYGLIYSVYI